MRRVSTLSSTFWTSRLNVSSSVWYGVGWALFVLLGFFIRESSNRCRHSQLMFLSVGNRLQEIVRHLRQIYPLGTWHPGDRERIMSHLVAYPIALKMSLRNEREASQLHHILHPDDLNDVLNADSMHLHCSRVVRAYFSASEEDTTYSFHHVQSAKNQAGKGVRYFVVIDVLDTLDFSASQCVHCRVSTSCWLCQPLAYLHVHLDDVSAAGFDQI